jgi:hypothetical protein
MVTSTGLSAIAGLVVSLLFAYIPWLRDWFYGVEGDAAKPGLTPDQRRAVIGAALVVVAMGVFGLGCAGVRVDPFGSPLVADAPAAVSLCGRAGLLELVSNLLAALVANQAIYPLLPRQGSKA